MSGFSRPTGQYVVSGFSRTLWAVRSVRLQPDHHRRRRTLGIRCSRDFVGLPFHLLLPLISAIGYVIGALLLKRASDLGADVWRSTRIINYTQALMAMPLWLLGGTIQSFSLWWQPAVARPALLCRAGLHAARVDYRRRLGRDACSRREDSSRRAAERRAHRRPHRRAALDGGGLEQRRHRAAERQSRAITPARRNNDPARRARRGRVRELRRAGPEVLASLGDGPLPAARDGVRGRVFTCVAAGSSCGPSLRRGVPTRPGSSQAPSVSHCRG